MKNNGFTLIELSIVLVIIGLIVGGVLVGQDLIKSAELRNAIGESKQYQSAINAFRLKYNGLPGDLKNAETLWGQAASGSSCQTTLPTTTETCNGDGNKYIGIHGDPGREVHRVWQHLSNAAMIEGSYTGVPGPGGIYDTVIGTNAPAGPIKGSGWSILSLRDAINIGSWYNNIFRPNGSYNWLELGGDANTGSLMATAIMTPQDAWNIDDKMDDGKPGTGRVTTFNTSTHANCATSSTASSADYNLSYTDIACNLFFGF